MTELLSMPLDFLPLDILCFCLAFWLGTYLLRRNVRSMRVCLTGLGLISYSFAMAWFVLSTAPSSFNPPLREIGQGFLLLPTLLWSGTLLFSLPEDTRMRTFLVRYWLFALLPLAIICCIASLLLHSSLPLMISLFLSFITMSFAWYRMRANRTPVVLTSLVLVVATGTSLAAFPHSPAYLIVGCMLFVLGITIAAQDAADQGEALLPDLFRSFDYALLTAFLFGGQMALIMFLGTGVTFPALALLLSTLATAIAIQVFARTFVRLLDTIAFATFPRLRETRDELHTVIDVLPRLQQEIDPDVMDEAEFTRLTRRALSHLGDLSRLASSPLTRLALIKIRLHARGIKSEDVLESAAELKTVLTESICRLKPRGKGAFGTSDEWRYYNALYFPYVIGLKPYSRRSRSAHSDPVVNEALDWFRTQVPERTLHNWQNTAARLVSQDLRSQNAASLSPKQPPKVKTGSVWQDFS